MALKGELKPGQESCQFIDTSGQADTVEEVGLDQTHPQEASIQHHTPSPDLEPRGEEKERPSSKQLEVRH